MVKAYKIVEGYKIDVVEERINLLLSEGWRLKGELIITPKGSNTLYSQNLIKGE